MKKSELIAALANDIARHGDGEVFAVYNKGKRSTEYRLPIKFVNDFVKWEPNDTYVGTLKATGRYIAVHLGDIEASETAR